MLHRPTAAATLLATLALAACGDDDRDENQSVNARAGDRARYCALAADLDGAGEKFFARLGHDAQPEQFQAAERRFVKRFARKIDQLKRAAPKKLRPDVEKVLAAQRQRAGLETTTGVNNSEASAAERRVKAYEKRNCQA